METLRRCLVYGGMLAFCILVWSLVLWSGCRVAHCGGCDSLRDPDERHMCRATEQHLKSECEFIKNPDIRQLCRERTGK